MPTNLPQQPPTEFAVIHLLALPLLFLVLSTLVESRSLSAMHLFDAFMRSGEIIATAEFGFGRILADRK
jgi:hypothetical protein